jgi:predicted  nucleic acid-binding Zn-ribbon protein
LVLIGRLKSRIEKQMEIQIPVSVGELLDKITILEIKSMFTDDEYVTKEINDLNVIRSTLTQYTLEHEVKLKKVNEKLWKIEDKLRKMEKEQRFDEEFIELARSVYIINDERARIKREINELTNSNYKEIKIY